MRNLFLHIIFGSILILGVSSCATADLKVSKADVTWREQETPDNDEIYHSIYLIGDVGGAEQGASTIPLIELKKQLAVDDRLD